MTIRERLIDVLQTEWPSSYTDIVDTLLKVPGVAIVELPEGLIDRAEAAVADATPGPWLWDCKDGEFMGCGQVFTMGEDVMGGNIAAPSGDLYPRSGYNPKADMQFIAAARTLVPELVAALKAVAR